MEENHLQTNTQFNQAYLQNINIQPNSQSLLSPSSLGMTLPAGTKILKHKKLSIPGAQQIQTQKQSSVSRSRKNSLQGTGSQSSSRQKALKDTMTNFVHNAKSGGSFLGGSSYMNLSSLKGGKALRDLSSQRSSLAHDQNQTPPRGNSKKATKKKKESRNQPQIQTIHNKPPLLTLQSVKRPETVKHQNLSQTQPVVNINLNTAVTSVRDSYPNPQIQASLNYYQPTAQQIQAQAHSHNHQHQLFSPVQLPQQLISELESVATPHKGCQTCSKINNYMTNINQKRNSVDDYSPSDNEHIISINQQDEHHRHHLGYQSHLNPNQEYGSLKSRGEELTNEKLQYQTLTNSSDTNAFAAAHKNRTYTPKRQLNMNMMIGVNSHEKSNEGEGGHRDQRSKSHRKKNEQKRVKSKGRKTIPALIIDEEDSSPVQNPQQNNPYFSLNPVNLQNLITSQNNPHRFNQSNAAASNQSANQQQAPKLVSLKRLKQILKSSQEGIGASCNEGKLELVQFKSLLENEIQEYFKQSLNKLMFFKKEIKNDIVKFHEEKKREIAQYAIQQLEEEGLHAHGAKREDELMLHIHNLQRKCESILKEVDLLTQKAEHSSKQIDSLRNKEFYQQTNEDTLLDKMHTLEQQLRTFKQQAQAQMQQLDDKHAQQALAQAESNKAQLKEVQKQLTQKFTQQLQEESNQQALSVVDQLKQLTSQQQKKAELAKKENGEALTAQSREFKQELAGVNLKLEMLEKEVSQHIEAMKVRLDSVNQSLKPQQVEEMVKKQVQAKNEAVKDQLISYVEEKVAQLQSWVSPNQLDEKLEQLASKLKDEQSLQRKQVVATLNQQSASFENLSKIVQEQESRQELLFNSLQERMQQKLEEELNSRDEQLRELFETEKQEFIQPIQENMQILDNMLKEYTQVKQHQILSTTSQNQVQMQSQHNRSHSGRYSDSQQPNNQNRQQLIESGQQPPHHMTHTYGANSSNQIANSSQSNNDSYNKFLQQQFQDSNGDPEDNSILRSSVSGTHLHMDDTPDTQGQQPFADLLEREDAQRYGRSVKATNNSRSRQQNIMVQDFMKSSESLQADHPNNGLSQRSSQQLQEQLRMTVQSQNQDAFKREGVVNIGRPERGHPDEMIDRFVNEERASDPSPNTNARVQEALAANHNRAQSKEYNRSAHKANSVDFNSRNDHQFEEVKVEDLEIYSPYHAKGKSESVHSASGSYSEGNRFESIHAGHHGSAQNRVKRHKSGKTSHQSIEKTNSDFFNLTQESHLELMNQLMNSNFNNEGRLGAEPQKSGANSQLNNYSSPIFQNQLAKNNNLVQARGVPNAFSEDEGLTLQPNRVESPLEESKSDQQRQKRQREEQKQPAISKLIEKKFGKLSEEITEDVFINELMAAFDECFGFYEQNAYHSHMPQTYSPQRELVNENPRSKSQFIAQPANNLYLYERIEPAPGQSSQMQDLYGQEVAAPKTQPQPQQMMRRQNRQNLRTGAANPLLNIDIEDQKQEEEKDRHFLDKRRVSPNPQIRYSDRVELENQTNLHSRNQNIHSQGGSLNQRMELPEHQQEVGSQDNRSQVQVKDFEEDDAIDVALASHDYSDRYELSISNNGD